MMVRKYKLSASRLCAAASLALLVISHGGDQAKADPATAMLVVGVAESVLSLFSKGPDLTIEALNEQRVMLNGIHARLSASEDGLSVLLKYVAVLPDEFRRQLENDRDINRSETLEGFIDQIQGISEDIIVATKSNRAASLNRLRAKMDFALLNMQPERTSLLKRSNFVIPTLAIALITELNARRTIPQDGAEIPRTLRAYDKKFSAALDPHKQDSLVARRADLELVQKAKEFEITRLMTGSVGAFPDKEVHWFSHTLQALRQERRIKIIRPARRPGMIDGADGPYEMEVAENVPYDVHTRVWNRKIRKSRIVDGLDANDFTIEIIEIGPNQTDAIVVDAPKHSIPDLEYEKSEREKYALSAAVNEYNSRAYAINSLKGLEQIAVQCRALIAQWDEAQAAKIAKLSQAFRPGDAVNNLTAISDLSNKAEIGNAIDEIYKARLKTFVELEKAANEYEAAVEKARSKRWISDVSVMLQLLRVSFQVQQINNRLEAAAELAKVSAEVKNNITIQSNTFIAVEDGAASEPVLPTDAYISSLTPMDKVEYILNAIKYAESQPASNWINLPAGATLVESRLSFAISLLNSMGHTYADKELKAYRNTINESAVSGSLKEILKATLLPTPTGGSELTDGPAQVEYRRRVNALLRPFAVRRLNEGAGTMIVRP